VDAVHVFDSAGRKLSNVDQSQLRRRRSTAQVSAHFFKQSAAGHLPVMAVAIFIRALDLARIFDIVWALTRGGPGNDDRDYLDLYLHDGISTVRDQLHGRGGVSGDQSCCR
jgi:hypothetical protein